MEFMRWNGKDVRILCRHRLGNPSGGNGISTGIMCIPQRHPVKSRGSFKRSLSSPVLIDRLVNNQGINNRGGIDEGFDSMANGLMTQKREVVGSVVDDDRDSP